MIRPARDDDFPMIAAITNHYIATTTIHFAYEPVPVAEVAELWQRGRDRYPWLVLEEAGEVLGYAKAGTWRERAAYRWTAETGLYVADAARGRGLGTALYTALLAEVEARGFHSAVAGITLPNAASVKLHVALGFTSVGTVRDAGFKFEHWCDVEFWQKVFSPAGAS